MPTPCRSWHTRADATKRTNHGMSLLRPPPLPDAPVHVRCNIASHSACQ